MTTIQVFDPALCCSSGVCGVDVDQALVTFSADIDWVKSQGVSVERFNLAQQPEAFANHPAVRELLQAHGEAALPVLLVDGALAQRGGYPSRSQLMNWSGLAPKPLKPAISVVAAGSGASAGGCCGPKSGAKAEPGKCC